MADGRRRRIVRRAAHLAPMLAVAVSLTAVDVVLVPETGSAVAQEGPVGFVGRLFGGRPRRYIDDAPGGYYPPPRYYIDPPAPPRPSKNRAAKPTGKAARKTTPRTDASPAGAAAATPAPIVKSPDAKVVLVVGDFMALSLAKGLDGATADDANVRIVDRTDGSSGLVRDDHFDWPERIGAIIDEEKPAAVVVMLGSNDRQAIRNGAESDETRSEAWTAEYARRMNALAEAVRERKLPLVWVGLPAFRSARMSDDVAFFNELYRQAASSSGGEFVDVWDGFVDANGAFASTGPDVAGQPARLRNGDGITMTPQGAAKLAFFAEKPLEKILGADFGGTAMVSPPKEEKAVPQNPANATAVPAIALGSPSLDGGDALLGGSPSSADPLHSSPRERLVNAGTPLPASAGRADDFAWNVKAGPVGPVQPQAPVISRGTFSLDAIRSATGHTAPPSPMPSLQDAIIEDWSTQKKIESEASSGQPKPSKAAPYKIPSMN